MDDVLYEASRRCPKGIKNGPCGAMNNGRCELGGICAWAEAYKALEANGKTALMKELAGAERFSRSEKKGVLHGLLVGASLAARYKPRLKSAPAPIEKSVHPFESDFAVTTELDPPHGTSTEKMREFLSGLPEVDCVNIVDNPMGRPLMSGILPALLAIKHGYKPIYQVTCRSKNIEAIQSDLFTAYACGARHVLALTGDYVQNGVKPVFDIDSAILARLIKSSLAKGQDFSGAKIDAPIDFFVGVAANPNAVPLEAELLKLEKKMQFADFVQTQAVFDVEVLETFAKSVPFAEKILVGILPLKDAEMAERISKVPGIKIPDKVVSSLKKNPDAGLALAKEMAKAAKRLGFGGMHIMPMMDAGVVRVLAK